MMTVYEYASDVNKTVDEILKLCHSLEIKVNNKDDLLSDDDIILLDNEIENTESVNNERRLEPNDYIRIDVPYIELTTDQMEELRTLTDGYGRLIPVTDDVVRGNVGEESPSETQ